MKIFPVFCALLVLALGSAQAASLPWSTIFRGEPQFHSLLGQAYAKNWPNLPLGERTTAVGLALVGTPYGNWTLEIDDRIEAPSVNLKELDCWTFFEIALAFARMLEDPRSDHTPQRLLYYIELDRYRGGRCDGTYLSRLHFLEEWAADNEARGLVRNITQSLGGVRMPRREITTMSGPWRSYRYLRVNPGLVRDIRAMEARVSDFPVYFIPKKRVPAIEPKLQDGDIICITTSWQGCYSSHVGLAYRDPKGVLRFLHATSTKAKGRAVVVDSRLSTYLNAHRNHTGIFVVRPVR